MATSTYFSKFDHSNEQNLIEDLIIESIRIYGHDVYYLPRSLNNLDTLYGEDPLSSFDAAYPIEMFIKSVDGFEGEGTFASKFGLEIRQQITFTLARRTWSLLNLSVRPKEGDLVWFPLTNKLFEIQFVEHEAVFYQTGRLQTYDLQCELFEYSHEQINTGLSDIDQVEINNSYTTEYTFTSSGSPYLQVGDIVTGQQSSYTAEVSYIDVPSTTIRVVNQTGEFISGETITNSNNVTATISSKNTQALEFETDTLADNITIQNVSDDIIDFSENNPFSEIY